MSNMCLNPHIVAALFLVRIYHVKDNQVFPNAGYLFECYNRSSCKVMFAFQYDFKM